MIVLKEYSKPILDIHFVFSDNSVCTGGNPELTASWKDEWDEGFEEEA